MNGYMNYINTLYINSNASAASIILFYWIREENYSQQVACKTAPSSFFFLLNRLLKYELLITTDEGHERVSAV